MKFLELVNDKIVNHKWTALLLLFLQHCGLKKNA